MNDLLWFSRATAGPERRRVRNRWTVVASMALLAVWVGTAWADAPPPDRPAPPRLGFLAGKVSFWRPGTAEWEPAQVNIPLAGGDALATDDGRVEVQVGGRSFLRLGPDSQLLVKSLEPDFLQIDLTAGTATVDLRDLSRGDVIEVDTPNAALTFASDGIYRIDVGSDSSRLVVRRGGLATVRPAGGSAVEVPTGQSLLVDGMQRTTVTVAAAPDLDEWDRWNYERADQFYAATRAGTLPVDVYGAHDLERYGSWRVVATYGRVWVPYVVPVGWAPYSVGRWLDDPYWGWTWVDAAPWGWAPFHYGRWVYVTGGWGWAPGPVFVRPAYAPALVAFFGSGGVSFGISVPFVSWVALGWGEPLVPWWGPVGFYGRPCWHGWGGPHVVNNIVIDNSTVVTVERINLYRNSQVPNAVVGVPKDRFHGWSVDRVRLNKLPDLRPDPQLATLRSVPRRSTGAPLLPPKDEGGVPPAVFRSAVEAKRDRSQPTTNMADFTRQGPAQGRPGDVSGPLPRSIGKSEFGASGAADRLRRSRESLAEPRLPAAPRSAPPRGSAAQVPKSGGTTILQHEPQPRSAPPPQPVKPGTTRDLGTVLRERAARPEPAPRRAAPDVQMPKLGRSTSVVRVPQPPAAPPPRAVKPDATRDLGTVLRERAARSESAPETGAARPPSVPPRSLARSGDSAPLNVFRGSSGGGGGPPAAEKPVGGGFPGALRNMMQSGGAKGSPGGGRQ